MLSREGASNRVNGVVILDLANPAHPKVASTFDNELTGGVHNMFATNDHLFAVSGGAKYVIINAEGHLQADVRQRIPASERAPARPLGARRHRVLGAGRRRAPSSSTSATASTAARIEKPKLINTCSGQQRPRDLSVRPEVDRQDVSLHRRRGDEPARPRVGRHELSALGARRRRRRKGGIAQTSGGYTHIVDFTDPMNPRKVGRYQLEDYGSHDIIVENDILYQAYYDGGVRVVDVSGMLLGNLYDQGREIAVFKPYDPEGYTAERAVRDERDAVEGPRAVHRLQQRAVGGEARANDGRPVARSGGSLPGGRACLEGCRRVLGCIRAEVTAHP